MDANAEELFAEQPKPESFTISLQKLWRKISFLFWQHPLLLWSPLLIADIARYWIGLAGKHLSRVVIYTLLPHSVLSSQADAVSANTQVIISLVAGVVTWISYFLAFFVYSLAFIFIANCVHKLTIQLSQRFELQGSRIITTALRLASLLTCLSLAVALLSGWVYQMLPIALFQTKQTLSILLLVIAFIATIFAARPFLRAASPVINKPPMFTSRVTVLAWILLSGALLLSTFFSFALMYANIPLPSHSSTILSYFLNLVISLITAMPYIPMMIGIAVLAQENHKLKMHQPLQN